MTGGLIIRKYLIDHGITQAFVAKKCGWSRQKTNAILTGRQKLTFEYTQSICDSLNLPYDYFFNAANAAQDSA